VEDFQYGKIHLAKEHMQVTGIQPAVSACDETECDIYDFDGDASSCDIMLSYTYDPQTANEHASLFDKTWMIFCAPTRMM
jgi:hypothetical protein